MATSQHTLYLALLLCSISAVCSQVSMSNFIPFGRVLPADSPGPLMRYRITYNSEFWMMFASEFQCSLSEFSHVVECYLVHCTLDRPCIHSDDAHHCVFTASLYDDSFCLCSQPSAVLHPVCLNCVKHKPKFSTKGILYYSNSVACFNIQLCGDVESNPGPEQSDETTTRQHVSSQLPVSTVNLNIYIQNVRSLKNKLDTFHSLFTANLQPAGIFNCFALTETWLTADVADSEISIPDFTIFRNDRNGMRGGGVILGCHNSLHCYRRAEFEHPELELLWVELRLTQRNKMLLGVFYRPPSASYQSLVDFANILTTVSLHYSTVCIVGDYNLPSLIWSPDSRLPVSSGSNIDDAFVDLMTAHDLHQSNFSTTRGNNILDLILHSNHLTVSSTTGDDIFESDHNSLRAHFKLDTHTKLHQLSRRVYNYRKADLNDLRRTLECIPWNILGLTDNCEEATSLFHDLVEAALADVVPVVNPRRPSPPWFDGEVRQALKAKQKAFRKKKSDPTTENTLLFKTARTAFKHIARAKYIDYLSSLAADVGNNPKRFWSFVKNRSKRHALPSVLQNETTGEDASNPSRKASLLMDYFQSVYTPTSDDAREKPPLQSYNLDAMPVIHISDSEVLHELSKLDASKASGPDNLSCLLLKSYADIFHGPLAHLFRMALSSGTYPSQWKAANLVAVHKSGKKQNVQNYRPISLLPQVSKVFEKILCQRILQHVQPAVSEQQHGFVSGRDCSTNLTSLLQEAYHAVDRGRQLDVVYTDFSKAFDRVSHDLLLYKLTSYNLHPGLLQLLRSYLSNRKHRVVVEGQCSAWHTLPSGVPQGSILGPLLFTLFVNDIPILLCNKSLMFADDLKIFRQITSSADAQLLQHDLSKLLSWSSDWQLSLNANKCSVLSITLKRQPVLYDYHIGNDVLTRVNVQKDLGILIDTKLSFIPNVDHIIKKANRMSGLIWRNFRSINNKHALRTLYCTLIRPHLEYCTVTFNSISNYQEARIERVQRRFLNFMHKALNGHNDNVPEYVDLCDLYKLSPLSVRRTVNDCLFLHKHFHNHYSLTDANPFSLHVPVRRTRFANEHILHVPRSRVEVTKRGFVSRISSTYNGLHGRCDVFGVAGLASFRTQIYSAINHSA